MSESTENSGPEKTRAGFVAVIGAPNAGKSTLVNALVGTKVSIVTHKVQTTRSPVRGVAMHGNTQLVLVDTPGIFQPRRRLDRAMVKAAWGGAGDADAVLLMVDAPDLAAMRDRFARVTAAANQGGGLTYAPNESLTAGKLLDWLEN